MHGEDGAIVESKGDKNRQQEIEAAHQLKAFDTPRTKEACRKLGLTLEDLSARSYDSFYIPGDKKELQTLRFEHYEKKRKERLGQMLAERAKVMAANAKKGEVPGVQSGQFLCMLESLFEKEAKRLELDLKSQLRQHSSLVAANEEQLRKEEQMQNRMSLRDRKIADVQQRNKDNANRTKEKMDARLDTNAQLLAKIDTEFQDKQARHASLMLAEEERMERFQLEKAQTSNDKAAHWKKKVERMKERNHQLALEKQQLGEFKLQELEDKISSVQARREDEQQKRVVRSEEQHLHLMDVRAEKDRRDRVDGFRRNELKDQIDNNVERIETLLALKDQLLDQRKARTIKAESTRGSRGLNLGRDVAPGPGQYEAPKSCMFENPGVKVAQSKTGHSEFIDAVTRTTAANPAPGAYDIARLPNGDLVDQSGKAGAKFGDGKRDSYLDDAIKAKESVPAPGRYEAKSQLDNRATKMRRDKVVDTGTDKFSSKKYPVWARPATETPGPAGYSVDDYTRKDVLRRAQRSLPNLTRDMYRPPKAPAN
eukprot:TRINITY_DN61214_c0_g1_i1.p1 TRINITY_DN61214_c0_g1~~TRINITY_DN61214_c0_g1_i1.p1  ORF type:complete len:581 (-),score=140.62 TRINITY_DN61214_c0_g1_i1:224-1840(-)